MLLIRFHPCEPILIGSLNSSAIIKEIQKIHHKEWGKMKNSQREKDLINV